MKIYIAPKFSDTFFETDLVDSQCNVTLHY